MTDNDILEDTAIDELPEGDEPEQITNGNVAGWDGGMQDNGGGIQDLQDGEPQFGRRKGGVTPMNGAMGMSSGPTDKFQDIDTIADIADIPDVGDEGGEVDDITTKIADAPNVMTNKVQSMQELDHELMFQLPTAADGVDLTCLTKFLVPQEKVLELDAQWDFDILFTEVSSIMQEEDEAAEDAALAEEPATPAGAGAATADSSAAKTESTGRNIPLDFGDKPKASGAVAGRRGAVEDRKLS